MLTAENPACKMAVHMSAPKFGVDQEVVSRHGWISVEALL
jgi:hypothetical protein